MKSFNELILKLNQSVVFENSWSDRLDQEDDQRRLGGVGRGTIGYRRIGHDRNWTRGTKNNKEDEIIKNVWGVHPGDAPLPHIWISHPAIERSENLPFTIHQLKNRSDTHDSIFGSQLKHWDPRKNYYLGGRIDHVRKIITVGFSHDPRLVSPSYSSTEMDRTHKALRLLHPEYAIHDSTHDIYNPIIYEPEKPNKPNKRNNKRKILESSRPREFMAPNESAIKNLLIDILGKHSYSKNKESIQSDWDRRNPNRPRDPTGSFGERPRRDVYLNLHGLRNNIKGVIKRNTPLGQRLGAELKAMPDPNPRAGGQWPEIKGETPHFSDPNHPASVQNRIIELIRMQLRNK